MIIAYLALLESERIPEQDSFRAERRFLQVTGRGQHGAGLVEA